MTTEDILFQNLSIQLLAFWVIAWEALLVVGNVETTVASTLESTEHARTGRGSLETNIEVDLEWSRCIFIVEGLSR